VPLVDARTRAAGFLASDASRKERHHVRHHRTDAREARVEEQQWQLSQEAEGTVIPGFVFQHVYRMDANPDEVFLVVAFESRDAYLANARSAERHKRYENYRAVLAADPEWHDGEIAFSSPSSN
jgi:heme-degrading monooxygenase HmoA